MHHIYTLYILYTKTIKVNNLTTVTFIINNIACHIIFDLAGTKCYTNNENLIWLKKKIIIYGIVEYSI